MISSIDSLNNTEVITIILSVWALMKTIGAFILNREKKLYSNNFEIEGLKTKVEKMSIDYEDMSKSFFKLENSIELSLQSNENQRDHINSLSSMIKESNIKIDSLFDKLTN